MAQIGKRNSLIVLHSTPHGIYLDGGDHGEILLPNRYIPKGTSIGEALDVFIYRDSEDRLVATTETPFAMVGEFAYLRAVSDPADELLALARCTPLELSQAATPLAFALDKLCNRTLRGMFDGATTAHVDWDHGAGFVIDLSAVYNDREALPLVMLAATSWLTSVLHRNTDRRSIQVVDEAWAAVRHGARHFQASLNLSRTFGVSMGMSAEGMVDHLKDIPAQLVDIVKHDPKVLDSYANFKVALMGPE